MLYVVPEQPRNLRGKAVSPSSVQLTWDSPETLTGTAGDEIDRYELYYNDTVGGRNVHVTIDPPVTSYLIDDLAPNTDYTVKVAARSERGEGAPTPPITVRTLEGGLFIV